METRQKNKKRLQFVAKFAYAILLVPAIIWAASEAIGGASMPHFVLLLTLWTSAAIFAFRSYTDGFDGDPVNALGLMAAIAVFSPAIAPFTIFGEGGDSTNENLPGRSDGREKLPPISLGKRAIHTLASLGFGAAGLALFVLFAKSLFPYAAEFVASKTTRLLSEPLGDSGASLAAAIATGVVLLVCYGAIVAVAAAIPSHLFGGSTMSCLSHAFLAAAVPGTYLLLADHEATLYWILSFTLLPMIGFYLATQIDEDRIEPVTSPSNQDPETLSDESGIATSWEQVPPQRTAP